MTAKLSVSSVILAAVLSGCSQQQVMGGAQISGSQQQVEGGALVSGSQQQVEGGAQISGSQQQVEGGAQTSGSQQQVENSAPVVVAVAPTVVQPRVQRAPVHRVYKKQVQPRRVYTQAPKRRSNGLGLPAAKPGQCFAKVQVPAKYTNKSRRVLIQGAKSKRVLVRAPQYRWVNKRVQTRKAYYVTRTIPAQYKTHTRRVLVKPAYNTWRKGHGAITRIDNMTGQIMCRVQVPAVYKNVSRRVLVRPAQKIRTLVPATYKTVKQKKFVAPALYKTVHTPARYKTQNYRVKTSNARYVWRSVLCQTNAPKHYKRKAYRAAPKQYKQAPRKQYRKAVVRTAPKRQQYSQSSGISYSSYLAVMNAGSSKTKLNSAKKMNKKAVLRKATKRKAKSSAPKKMPPKMTSPKKVNKQFTKQTKKATKQSIVSGIQKALKAKGFDPGAMDGKMGPGTAAALKAFQKSRGLPIGQLNKDTFRALGLIR